MSSKLPPWDLGLAQILKLLLWSNFFGPGLIGGKHPLHLYIIDHLILLFIYDDHILIHNVKDISTSSILHVPLHNLY